MANPRAVRFLKEITNQIRPNLIFLSETLVRKGRVEEICKILRCAGCFAVDTQSHGGGLALLWKNEKGVEIKGSCNHYIDFEVNCAEVGRWRYTGLYGCPERARRTESWNLIRGLAEESRLPWCIIGDFNDIMYDHEKKGGRMHPRRLMEGFKKTLNECNLRIWDIVVVNTRGNDQRGLRIGCKNVWIEGWQTLIGKIYFHELRSKC